MRQFQFGHPASSHSAFEQIFFIEAGGQVSRPEGIASAGGIFHLHFTGRQKVAFFTVADPAAFVAEVKHTSVAPIFRK